MAIRPIILEGPGRPKRKWTNQLEVGPSSGSVVPAEYYWGTHSLATHVAEALKSQIFASVVGAAVVLTAVPTFVYARQESYPEGTQSFVRQPAVAGATPRPIPLLGGAPQGADLTLQAAIFEPLNSPQGPTVRPLAGGPLPVDLTQQGSIAKPIPARQGGVPSFTVGDPQDDPSQLAARLTPPQPAAAITPNPIAGFFVVPPQTEERPTRSIWPAQVAGSRTRVIALTSGAPQVWDFTQQALVEEPAFSVPVVSYALRILYAAPQLHDFTQQGVIRGTAQALQAKVPAAIWAATQADPSQIAARMFQPTPLVFGRVPALLRGGQPQFSPYQIPAALCAPPDSSTVVPGVFGWGARGRIGGSGTDPWSRIGSESAKDQNSSVGSETARDPNSDIGSGDA